MSARATNLCVSPKAASRVVDTYVREIDLGFQDLPGSLRMDANSTKMARVADDVRVVR